MSISKQINLAGGLALAGYVGHAILSWFLGAGIGATVQAGARHRAFFEWVGGFFHGKPTWFHESISHGGPFREFQFLVAGYTVPLALQTLCFIAAVWMVYRADESILAKDGAGHRIKRWSMAFAFASVAAYDVMTPDIWLGIPWGRMVLSGSDPYLNPFSEKFAAGTCLDITPIRMTYGPVWAIVSAVAAFFGGGLVLVSWFLLKLVLLGSWIGCLALVSRMSQPLGAKRHATAMLIIGWLPIGVHSTVAEGHNDGLMVMFLLLWLANLPSVSMRGPLFFAGSVFTKFAVAPVAIVDAIFHMRTGGVSPLRYALRILPAAIVALPVGFYLLSDGRLEEIGNMRMWRYLEPYDLLIAAQQYLGIYIPFKSWLTRLVFGVVVAFALINLWRKPMIENAWMASFALLSAIMFTWLGHVWPWFYVWLLPFAALLPNRLLARFVIGAAMVAPFSILNVWNVPNIGDGHSIPASLAVYGAAFGLMLVSSWLKWRIDGVSREISQETR